jgi:hypothetical protein
VDRSSNAHSSQDNVLSRANKKLNYKKHISQKYVGICRNKNTDICHEAGKQNVDRRIELPYEISELFSVVVKA